MANKLAAIAIGGNSLIPNSSNPDIPHQWDSVRETCKHLAMMVEQGWDIVVTHGNGPQVGFILRRSELASGEVHTVPLDLVVADTQGSIGYMLQQALQNEFRARGINKQVVTIVTQILVDADDPGFSDPSKPIGGYLSEEKAENYRAEGWSIIEDSGRGLRRVVASPIPRQIIELDVIKTLLDQGIVVIAAGGGGIPVVENSHGELRELKGSYAVIDKDRATALLATSIKADMFLISTGVEKVALNFNQPNVEWLDKITLAEARRYIRENHFAKGSMRPKIEAVISFLEQGGEQAVITNPENLAKALEGTAGTWVVRS